MVLVQLKDNGAMHFAAESEGGDSLMKAFSVGREAQALGIKCFLVLMRNAFGDGNALQCAAAALVDGDSAKKTTVYVATPDDERKRQFFFVFLFFFFFRTKDFNEVTFHREDQKLRQPTYPLEKVCQPLSYPLCPRPRLPLSAPPY